MVTAVADASQKEWRVHVNEVAEKSLFPEAESWVSIVALHIDGGWC